MLGDRKRRKKEEGRRKKEEGRKKEWKISYKYLIV
jgi:hypothetical protein